MNLFEFSNDRIIVNPVLSSIKEFKALLSRQNSEDIFAYIFHIVDYRSPYAMYEEDRKSRVLEDIPIKVDKVVEDAVRKYEELTTTEAVLMLNSAKKAVRTLRNYFEEIDVTQDDDPGKASKDLINNIRLLGSVIQGLKELEDEVKKEKQTSKNIRKSVELNEFNK
jgi:hypothetical protein